MRKQKIVYLLLMIMAFGVCQGKNKPKSPPNVVFIMCDDLNDYSGAFGGHPQVKTPNIDQFARSAVQFVNAQSNVPVCQPSRNSLFTGVYPHESRDFGWVKRTKQPVLKYNKTILTLLKENGYKTYGTGKLLHSNEKELWNDWGMNEKYNYGPFVSDGEKLVAYPSVPEPYCLIGPIDGSYGRLSEVSSSYNKNGKQLSWVYGWDMKPLRYVNDDDRDMLQDELHAQWALNKIKALDANSADEPFFLGIGFVRPHTPLYAPDKYFDMYPLDELELDKWLKNDDYDTFFKEMVKPKNKGYRYYRTILRSYNGDRELALKHFLQAYLACVTFVDEQIGKVVEAIENSRFKENTLIILTSDHGWQMGEKNYLFKNSPLEESARIPLIVKAPEAKSGVQVEQPVSLIDLFPTIVDYCALKGTNKLNEKAGDLGGFSLRPLMQSSGKGKWKGPNGALTIVGNFGVNIPVEKQNYSYRTKNWRYIHYGNGKEELYNHSNDIYEWNNLAMKKEFNEIKNTLRQEMNMIVGVDLFKE